MARGVPQLRWPYTQKPLNIHARKKEASRQTFRNKDGIRLFN
jgi:hypothetical protein